MSRSTVVLVLSSAALRRRRGRTKRVLWPRQVSCFLSPVLVTRQSLADDSGTFGMSYLDAILIDLPRLTGGAFLTCYTQIAPRCGGSLCNSLSSAVVRVIQP
jgi:hypothetical protein